MSILHDELPNIDVTVSSQNSPDLADAAFMRPEARANEPIYRRVIAEPFVVVLPRKHRLAAHEAIEPREIVDETFLIAPTSRLVIEDYLKRSGPDILPDHEVDNQGRCDRERGHGDVAAFGGIARYRGRDKFGNRFGRRWLAMRQLGYGAK